MSYTHAAKLAGQRWRKSSHSGAQGNCVQFAAQEGGLVAVRDSKNPEGPALLFTRDEISALLAGVKDGEFDDLA